MKRTLITGALALSVLTGTALGAGPVLPLELQGGAPSGILVLEDGSCLITDTFNKVVWKQDPEGQVTLLAGQIGVQGLDGAPIGRYADGTLDTAFFLEPWDVVPVLEGYAVTDSAAHVVRYISEEGVQTLVGSGRSGRRDARGIDATLSRPTGLAVDEEGLLYIADTDNGSIRVMDQEGYVTTLCTGLDEPTGLCWHEGKLYVAETGGDRISVIRDGEAQPLVGLAAGGADGRVERAGLTGPQDVAIGPDGAVYIADTGSGSVRKLYRGQVTTVLGLGEQDDAPVLPRSLQVAGDQLLVADPFTSRVLSIPLEMEPLLDVPDDAWYHDAVLEARERGLLSGVGEGVFAPEGTMTRAMFVTALANLCSALEPGMVIDGEKSFADVPEEAWYAPSVRWAADMGVTHGAGDRFMPDGLLTRQQLATFLWNYARAQGLYSSAGADLSTFPDWEQVADYARTPMSWAVHYGLLKGSGGLLAPEGYATRAQAAQLLIRFMDWLQA